MKSIAVITSGQNELGDFLKENLEEIFAGAVPVYNRYLKDIRRGQVITDAVVIIPTPDWAMEVSQYLRDNQHMILLQRTIKESETLRLAAIPTNTKVLVVNDSPETSRETIALFCQLGINHLDMIPYIAGEDYSDIKIAVTPGERPLVPPEIEMVIDVGNRCVDFTTFSKIINKLGLENREVGKRLVQYAETIVNLDNGIKQQYKELFTKNVELEIVLNLSREGMLLVDNSGQVGMCNESFRQMFPAVADGVGQKAATLFPPGVFAELVAAGQDDIIQANGRVIIVTKHKIKYFGESAGYLFVLQEANYIRQLDNDLSKRLRKYGLVARYRFADIRTNSPSMIECRRLAEKIACSDHTVMITGESGTGKELFAQSIHNASRRAKQPFVAVNCAAVPDSLLESELFGYEGGAFTGALKEGKEGLFEKAHNGTIFLDEIGDMPLHIQAKLLRVLQEKQVMPVGSQRVISINTRVIAATNRNLSQKMADGLFRDDLFYRPNVLPIQIPALRERAEDIPELLRHFLQQEGLRKIQVTDEVDETLIAYRWPGNVRELQNVAAYIRFMVEEGEPITSDRLPQYLRSERANVYTCEQARLLARCRPESALAVMRALDESSRAGRSIGRYYLQKLLAGAGTVIGETEIKTVLALLSELGLASSKVGRGSELTDKGRDLLNRMNRETV